MRVRTSLRISIGALVIVTLIIVSLYKVPTTFNISATTQILNIITGSSHRSPWVFKDAMIFFGYEQQGQTFTGEIIVLPNTRVIFERIGSGPLRLSCESLSAGKIVAKLYEAGKEAPVIVKERLVLVDHAPVKFAEEYHATVLPMSGSITAGLEMGDALTNRPALLLGGKVTLLARTLFGRGRYDAGQVFLDLGDYISVQQQGNAYGLLVVQQEPEISVIFRVIGKSISVYRFGTQGYEVYASLLTRIKNDHSLQAIWTASIFLLTMLIKWTRKDNKGSNK